MPTPGKVLVVLVMLLAPVWVILVSAVAQLNMSGGEQVGKLKQQVESLEKQVSDARRQVVALKDQITLAQVAMDEDLAVIRARQADLQKARSETIEMATRAKLQVASTQEAAKQAEATRDLRTTEKMQEIAAKEAAEKEVEALKQAHAESVEQLDKLRSEFKATIDSNRKLVERLKSKPRSS
jgi:chromosome segregation ATPase